MVKEGISDGGEVTITAVTTVAPALPVQEHRMPLSNLDLILPPIDVGVFFCYYADHPGGSAAAAALKAALAKTLVAYYPLAGEVVANAAGEPELLCSGRGVDVAEASAGDGTAMRDLRLGLPDESVEQLVPKKKAGVMAVQKPKDPSNMVNEATKEQQVGGHDVMVTVAPALPVQVHRLPLSNLDLLLPPLDVSLFFCYLRPAPTAAALKEALAKTLVAYYPLAGEVVGNADGEPELLCSGCGVEFTVANAAGVDLREIRLGAVDESVEKLVPVKKAGAVVAVKVTKFRCGGAVVGCTFDHRVCDAYSFNMFLVAWAAAARSSPSPPAPSFRRSLAAPRDPPPRAPSTEALINRLFSPRSAAPPPPAVAASSVNRIYRIAAADVAALKAAAGLGRTKMEAFTAHLWGLCSRAASPRQSKCCMGVVVDGRTRMFPDGAMKAYFGNVLTITYGVLGSGDLRRMALADVADDVHRWVAEAATGDHFRGLVDWVEALRPKPAAARAYLGGTGGSDAMACIVSSGMTFPVGKADFGTGLPAFASYHFPWPAGAGYVMPMPSARGDGDWVVYVHVAPELAKVMEEEPTVFRALENSYAFQ